MRIMATGLPSYRRPPPPRFPGVLPGRSFSVIRHGSSSLALGALEAIRTQCGPAHARCPERKCHGMPGGTGFRPHRRLDMLAYVEIALSAVVILVFAVERFRALPTDPKDGGMPYRISRSTTTAASYYTALSLYGAIALGVFAFLLLSPQALDRLVETAPGIGEAIPAWAPQSPPLLVALILTVLLPKIPLLSNMDEWFRRRLQRMAAIPHEVRRLSAELRRTPFRVSDDRRRELRDAMVAKGFEAGDVLFEDGTAPQHLWTKLSMLMHDLDGWEADERFTSYVLTYPNQFTALRLRYQPR